MLNRRRLLGLAAMGSAGLTLPRGLDATGAPDDAWLEALAGKRHKVFLDIRSFAPDGSPFRKVANLRTALTGPHGIAEADIGIAFGGSGGSVAYLLGESIWRTYPVGAAVASAASSPAEATSLREDPVRWTANFLGEVTRMVSTGTRVLACRNSIMRWAREFAGASGESVDSVNAKLIAGLHPGVEPVPAMVAAAVLAQGRGLGYVAIG